MIVCPPLASKQINGYSICSLLLIQKLENMLQEPKITITNTKGGVSFSKKRIEQTVALIIKYIARFKATSVEVDEIPEYNQYVLNIHLEKSPKLKFYTSDIADFKDNLNQLIESNVGLKNLNLILIFE